MDWKGMKGRKRIWRIIACLLCSVWSLSLANVLEHELPGLHAAQDAFQTVLSNCDADWNSEHIAQALSFSERGCNTPADAPFLPVATFGMTPSGARILLAGDGMPHPLESGTKKKTILRL
jgi:hypothetical protein